MLTIFPSRVVIRRRVVSFREKKKENGEVDNSGGTTGEEERGAAFPRPLTRRRRHFRRRPTTAREKQEEDASVRGEDGGDGRAALAAHAASLARRRRQWRRMTDNKSRHQRTQEHESSCDHPHGRHLSAADTESSKAPEPESETTRCLFDTETSPHKLFLFQTVSLLWKRRLDPRGKKKKCEKKKRRKVGPFQSPGRERKKKLSLALRL